MPHLSRIDLEDVATALADQTDYEHVWLVDPTTGETVFWTRDTGIDGFNPIDLDELDHLVPIDPLPSSVWYGDMVAFAEGIGQEAAGRKLVRALEGRGAFRRFKDTLHAEYPQLLETWYAFRDARAEHRAVEWLVEHELVDEQTADAYLTEHPVPELRPTRPPKSASPLLTALSDVPVVAILRSHDGSRLDAVLDTLVEAGIRALEVTLPTPGSEAAVTSAVRRFAGHAAVGVGTVLSADDVARAVDAGASFVVTPDTDPDVIAAARDSGLDVLPGAMTPTEVRRASRAGSTAVKLFPARSLGPQFVRDLRGPLPDVPLVPVGGVGLDDVAGFLSAGSLAVGVGGPLLGDALAGGDLAALRERATAYVEAARTAAE